MLTLEVTLNIKIMEDYPQSSENEET